MSVITDDAPAAATQPLPFVEVIEVWTPDSKTGRLTLASGIFGGHQEFADVTSAESFAKGEGLPGKAWEEARPLVLNGFQGSYFKRAEAAAAAGLTTAVAVPGGETVVVTLLSARGAPIARRFEMGSLVGGGGPDAGAAVLIDGLCELEGPIADETRRVEPWEGPIGQVLGSGAPIARSGLAATGLPAGYEAVVATPVYRKGRLSQVAAWYF